MPDPAILARARRGDMKAHEVLYASYGVPVYTLAIRILADPSLAEEVVAGHLHRGHPPCRGVRVTTPRSAAG
jgi:DNA-directed RNA polymerase specialized sigma24 family protein